MKMRLEVTLMEKHGDEAKFGAELSCKGVKENLIPKFYLVMLKAMRDTHTPDFYKALYFFAEADMDEMRDFFEGGEDDD